MKKYQRLDCVKGLLMSMDNQLNELFQKDNLPENMKDVIVNKYYDSIINFLNKESEK